MRLLLVYIICLAGYVSSADTLRLEAEDLPLSGKWKISFAKDASQGKLIFSGEKGEKNTINATFEIKRGGTFYLWVRAFSHGQGYRTLKIAINGKTASNNFGDEKLQGKSAGWICKSGGSFDLKQGVNSVTIVPNSPYSRLDVIVLSTDKNYKMPDDRRLLEKLPSATISNTKKPVAAANVSQLPLLLFHGGRPWTGQEAKRIIQTSGFKVKVIDSSELDGLGGAPIRFHLTDKFEPEAKDGISPEFRRLDSYRAVIVCSMRKNDLKQFYSPERLAALEKYLKNGGTLIVTENSPGSIAKLLPVTMDGVSSDVSESRYCLPVHKYFPNMPEKWPCFMGRKKIKAKNDAEVLVYQCDGKGSRQPYIAAWNIGRGKVIYINADWTRKTYFKQLRYWAYFSVLIGDLIAYGSGENTQSVKIPQFRFKQPPVKELGQLEFSLKQPQFKENDKFASAVVKDSGRLLTAEFANGTSLVLDKNSCSAEVVFPGKNKACIKHLSPPQLLVSGQENLNQQDTTFEAVGASDKNAKYIVPKYSFGNFKLLDKGGIAIGLTGRYNNSLYEIEWRIAPENLNVDGVKYQGLGWAATINFTKGAIEGAKWDYYANLGGRPDEHYAWRMACYGNPRGFVKVRFDKPKSSSPWFHFGSGQPFNWLTGPAGTFLEFIDRPVVLLAEQKYSAGSNDIELSNSITIGKKHGRIILPALWTFYSDNKADLVNNWQSVYQFLIRRYCRQQGLKIPQPYPVAGYNNTCTQMEKQKAIEAAKKLGFKQFKLEICPSPLESLASDRLAENYRQIMDAGLEPKCWSALGYTQGMDNPVAAAHKDWLIRDRNGKVLQWFGSHPVFDFYNPGYAGHWRMVCGKAVKNGLRHIYIDMGGVMPSAVNYASRSPSTQMQGMIDVFKFFADKGVSVGIEGQNPLALDEYWFRKNKYVNHTGNEFAFVNANIGAYAPDYLAMDYFRLGMNNAFIKVNTAPYAVDFEIVPHGNAQVAEMGKLNPAFLKAIELTGGVPFVRQTPFGTSWTGKNGAALFFWDKVKAMDLHLPPGWAIKEIFTLSNQKVRHTKDKVYDIPSKSVILISSDK